MQSLVDETRLALRRPVPVPQCALVAVLLVGCCGCGASQGPTGKVAGTVTLRGGPVGEGTVVFFKAVGVPAGVAKLTPSGEFRLERPIPVGEYQVAIQPPAEEVPAGAEDPKLEEALKKIPPKYWSETTSGLAADVKEGDNSFAFEMRRRPRSQAPSLVPRLRLVEHAVGLLAGTP